MDHKSNSVFISYRRDVSAFMARAVFQDLRAHEIDVFIDVQSIDSGQFDAIILNQIAARPYFLLILTPGTLDRCDEPGDWLRREVEHALTLRRIIVPLTTPNFSFAASQALLTGHLAELARFNAVNVPHDYFDEAMERLRHRFLKPIELPTTPAPAADASAVQTKLNQAIAEQPVTPQQLGAQDYFERALTAIKNEDTTAAIADATEAIQRDPEFVHAYNTRAWAYRNRGDYEQAIADYSESIRLNPDDAAAYSGRGWTYFHIGDFEKTIEDCTKAIKLDPNFAEPYQNRSLARRELGDKDGAKSDYNLAVYTNAIRVNPHGPNTYLQRGNARYAAWDIDGAIADFNQAIRLNPQISEAFAQRALAYLVKKNEDTALADCSVAIRLDPENADYYHSRGLIHDAKGDHASAVADFERALELDPKQSDVQNMKKYILKWTRKRGLSAAESSQ